MNIVFAITRYNYPSYVDFWKLVELSGFDTMYIDDIDISRPEVVIFTPMNGELPPHINNQVGRVHNAHIIHWCLERPSGAGGMFQYGLSNRQKIYDRIIDECWVSDRQMSSETMLRFVPLGSDYGLGEPGEQKNYDFCHMSYEVHRRLFIYNQFPPGMIGPNCWGEDRHRILQRSRFALNIHQDQFPFQEPLRFALFAAYGLPIVSESIKDAYPWNEDTMNFNPYDGMVEHLKEMLKDDYTRWKDMGLRARDRMCGELRFKKCVEEAVKESLSCR